MQNNKLAIFDLDFTLTGENVSFSFGKELYRTGNINSVAMITVIFGYFLQKLRFISLEKFHKLAFYLLFKDKRAEPIIKLAEEFIQKNFHTLFRPAMLKEFYDRKKEGNCSIQSSSPYFLVLPIKKMLDVNNCISTEYAIDDNGNFSYIKKIIDGRAKAEYLNYFKQNNGDVALEVAFYTDSIEDLPLLEIVNEAIVVNPRGKLKRIASRNLWKKIYIS